ncbi:uncharacterized protein LOC129588956 isoform X1 [Paramacrobiotus metropolitanus]|uniref:uncharacterized protein LOC129588956 isoform X1 n=1 Tax=Paramacrobiotus metropolitanus TaxID=2943436 RepID=UPI002445C88A|nr:uncharacterized protein LOC129588956 isoform X1 [Paramacrobiotus metropolitanus]
MMCVEILILLHFVSVSYGDNYPLFVTRPEVRANPHGGITDITGNLETLILDIAKDMRTEIPDELVNQTVSKPPLYSPSSEAPQRTALPTNPNHTAALETHGDQRSFLDRTGFWPTVRKQSNWASFCMGSLLGFFVGITPFVLGEF